METMDEIAKANQRLWDEEVRKGCGYTIPWLEVDLSTLRRFAAGEQECLPEPMDCASPGTVFEGVENRTVLCLAAGGGQQSVLYALLGAHVTVVDLSARQLEGDRRAAAHYGYDIVTVQADMRDLSSLPDGSFDVVYQAESMAYVPSVHEVYSEVARVIRPGGLYRASHSNPATAFTEWNGTAYCVAAPYSQKRKDREDGGIEFRHSMKDIFSGLVDAGFTIRRVYDETCRPAPDHLEPGTWDHERAYLGGSIVIVARKD